MPCDTTIPSDGMPRAFLVLPHSERQRFLQGKGEAIGRAPLRSGDGAENLGFCRPALQFDRRAPPAEPPPDVRGAEQEIAFRDYL